MALLKTSTIRPRTGTGEAQRVLLQSMAPSTGSLRVEPFPNLSSHTQTEHDVSTLKHNSSPSASCGLTQFEVSGKVIGKQRRNVDAESTAPFRLDYHRSLLFGRLLDCLVGDATREIPTEDFGRLFSRWTERRLVCEPPRVLRRLRYVSPAIKAGASLFA